LVLFLFLLLLQLFLLPLMFCFLLLLPPPLLFLFFLQLQFHRVAVLAVVRRAAERGWIFRPKEVFQRFSSGVNVDDAAVVVVPELRPTRVAAAADAAAAAAATEADTG
jgi:hypothetical protein